MVSNGAHGGSGSGPGRQQGHPSQEPRPPRLQAAAQLVPAVHAGVR